MCFYTFLTHRRSHMLPNDLSKNCLLLGRQINFVLPRCVSLRRGVNVHQHEQQQNATSTRIRRVGVRFAEARSIFQRTKARSPIKASKPNLWDVLANSAIWVPLRRHESHLGAIRAVQFRRKAVCAKKSDFEHPPSALGRFFQRSSVILAIPGLTL